MSKQSSVLSPQTVTLLVSSSCYHVDKQIQSFKNILWNISDKCRSTNNTTLSSLFNIRNKTWPPIRLPTLSPDNYALEFDIIPTLYFPMVCFTRFLTYRINYIHKSSPIINSPQFAFSFLLYKHEIHLRGHTHLKNRYVPQIPYICIS